MKIPKQLQALLEEGIIDDVVETLLSGKEASVYVVTRDGEYIAAKVYKARNARTFKNVATYMEGRNQTRNTRDKRAMRKKTSYGQGLVEESWRQMEHDALQRAFHGGVRVPEPYLLYDDVLLFELLLDEEGHPAPRLADVELNADVAELLHLEIFLQVKRLLAVGLIHGDLSAFNILVPAAGLTLIDMPQVIDPSSNNDAKELLARDLRNVTEHLARYDARLLRFRDCGYALFRHYQRGTLDTVTGPEEGGVGKRGRGRRGRDAAKGSAGRQRQKRKPGPEVIRAGEAPSEAGPRQRRSSEGARQRDDARTGGRRKPRDDARGPQTGTSGGPGDEAGPRKDGPPKRRRRRRRGPPKGGPTQGGA